MSRFGTGTQTEVQSKVVRPALLLNIFGEYWAQSDMDVTWNGHTYLHGTPFSIQGVAETTNTDTRMMNIHLAATPDNIARARQPHVWSDMSATIVFIDDTGTVIAGVLSQAYIGKVVSINVTHDAENPVVEVVCQDIMSLMENVAGLRFNTQDQQSRPGASTDTIFDALPKLQGREVMWLQKHVVAGGGNGGGVGAGGGGASINRTRIQVR